jgi:hypothetical protein
MSESKNQNDGGTMAAIPWGAIIATLPSLVDAAGRLFNKADAPPKSLPEVPENNSEAQLEAVIKRLEYFEALESEQAKLLQQAIEQLQNVSMSASLISKKANIAIAVAILSFAVSVFSFIL